MTDVQQFILQVSDDQAHMRLDLLLTNYAEGNNLGLSRTNIQKLILEGKVFLNSHITLKANHKVKPGEHIQVILPKKEEQELSPEEIPLDVIYEDDDLAVIKSF